MNITDVFIPQVLDGSLRRGGWIFSGQLEADTDGLEFGENVQVQGKNGAGSFVDPDWRTFFDGHCLTEPQNITFDKFNSRANINLGTMDNLLKGRLQDIGFTEQASPANDHQITGMTISNIVEHVLRRHCNAIFDATQTPDGVVTALDINNADSTPLTIRNVRNSNNLWQRLQELGGGENAGEFFRPFFTRTNEFLYQPVPAFWTPPPVSIGTLTDEHIRGQVRVKVNQADVLTRVGQVEIFAVATSTTVFNAEFPVNPAPGKVFRVNTGIWADDQARADELAENLFKWLTRPFTLQVDVDPGLVLFGDDGVGLDLGNAVDVTYDGPADDGGAGVHLIFNAQKFFIYGVNVRFDLEGKVAKATLTLEQDNG